MEILDIGQELKTERKRKGLSLERVYKDTKINIEFIESLENGVVEQLSHPVYAKGFVQNYAKYLGLDWKKIGEDFARIYQAEDKFQKYTLYDCPTSLKITGPSKDLAGYLKTIIILLTIIIIIGFGWFMYTSFNPVTIETTETIQEQINPDPEPDPVPSMSEQPASYFGDDPENILPPEERFVEQETEPAVSELPDKTILEETEAVEDAAAEEELISLENEGSTEPESIMNQVEPESEPSLEVNQNNNEDVTALEPSPSEVEIRAREDCWFSAKVDDSDREVYLRSGQSIQLSFEESVILTLGNAGGVDILLDGNPYPFEAVSGEVKTIEIPYPGDNES
ncbi:MAG: helix-turn-helix domain-containing protein [Desulfonatronovibrio sp.]